MRPEGRGLDIAGLKIVRSANKTGPLARMCMIAKATTGATAITASVIRFKMILN